ncbi:c-type cytochrome [Verrucomicrobia bacterium]|nr:c-type cytochrome [Verrucomicrobiota bacterium]
MNFQSATGKALYLSFAALLLQPSHNGELQADKPLVLGYEHLKQGTTSSQIQRGELLLGELNCTSCHQATENIAARLSNRAAPDLSSVGSRLTPHYLREYLSDPQSKQPGVIMPDIFHASEDSAKEGAIDFLVHFLVAQGGELQPARMGGSESLAEEGKTLFHKTGCVACHGPETSLDDGNQYLSLAFLAEKTNLDALTHFLQEPHLTRPSGRMPDFRLDASEARALAVYLLREQLENPQSAHADPGEEPGMAFDYYELDNIGQLPDFSKIEPKSSGHLEKFTLSLPVPRRNNHYAIRYHGLLKIQASGVYRFGIASDDGSRLMIDGQTVVNNDGVHGRRSRGGKIELNAGRHPFELQFFNGGGGSVLNVFWAPPGTQARNGKPIPTEVMVRNTGKPMIPLGTEPFKLDQAKARMGAQMFTALRCVSCHPMNNWKPMRPASMLGDLNLENANGCLGDKIRKGVPDYGLSKNQQTDIKAALQSYERVVTPPTASEKVHHTLAAFNCYACHERGGIGGPSDALAAGFFNTTFEIDLGEEGKIPPKLDHAGAKFKPQAMTSIMRSDDLHVRHYMATRMPAFPLSEVERFVKAVGIVDKQGVFAEESLFSEETASVGQRFTGVSGLACITCHRVAGQDALAIQGIDLSTIYDRVQPGWFKAFLLDPASFSPGTRMPQFWPDGKSAFVDILGGDPGKQVDAIWSYLSLKNSMPLPVGVIPKGEIAMELVPADKPIVHRTFMKDVGPRAILTGFPEKLNVAYDFNVVRMAKVWRGRFFDHSGVQSGRTDTFLEPLGTDVLDLPKGPAFAFLEDSSWAPWPDPELTSRHVGGRFKGYSLEKGTHRPVFRYELGTAIIEESPKPVIQPGGAILKRTFRITTESAAKGLYFLAVEGDPFTQLGNNHFRVNDQYEIRLNASFPLKPIIRIRDTKTQVLIPVPMDTPAAHIEQIIEW